MRRGRRGGGGDLWSSAREGEKGGTYSYFFSLSEENVCAGRTLDAFFLQEREREREKFIHNQ
jgi:hypothetical protein